MCVTFTFGRSLVCRDLDQGFKINYCTGLCDAHEAMSPHNGTNRYIEKMNSKTNSERHVPRLRKQTGPRRRLE